MQVITPQELPLRWLIDRGYQKRGPGNPKTRQKTRYWNCISAYDIESTRLAELEQSVMYVWQWCFYPDYTVVGRTWDEMLWLLDQLARCRKKPEDRLVVWVHNLSYEFSFLRGIWRFEPDEVFAVKSRKILKAIMGPLELRCSYLHTNMSLDEYCDKMGVEHKKLHGFDYGKLRYPWTPLSEDELAYCVHDVQGLCEALAVEMEHDGDNLYTIPLTSTGYVRRDCKAAMREVSHGWVQTQQPDLETYKLLRDAFRGGDTHASRFYAGQIVHDAKGADRSSSYPDIVCNCQFPAGPFFRLPGTVEADEVIDLIQRRKKAVVMRMRVWGLELADYYNGAPYLSFDKCDNVLRSELDNGRILRAEYLETALTDVDLRVLLREYSWRSCEFWDVAYARYGPLPEPLKRETIKYYKAKTELKNVDGQEVYYVKSKNKLNAIYGMMAQNILKRSILYTQEGKLDPETGELDLYPEDESQTDKEILDKKQRTAFLCYQWGCWVTAWARYRLREAIWTVEEQGGEFIYCDTDSVKYLGDVDWSEYNARRIKDSTASGALAQDPSGEWHYMGVMEPEGECAEFRTWGAKKYCYTSQDKTGKLKLHSVIAGVAKSAGAAELEAAGGISAFKPGFVFSGAGGLEAIYNDWTNMWVNVDEHQLHITPNVTLRPGGYRMGITADYDRILRRYQNTVDNP